MRCAKRRQRQNGRDCVQSRNQRDHETSTRRPHVCTYLCCLRQARCAIRLIVARVSRALTQFMNPLNRQSGVFFLLRLLSFKTKWKMCFLFTNYDISIIVIILSTTTSSFVLFSSSFESHILWRSQTIRGSKIWRCKNGMRCGRRSTVGVRFRVWCGVCVCFHGIFNFFI